MDLRDALKVAGASKLSIEPGDVCIVSDESVVFPQTPKRTPTPGWPDVCRPHDLAPFQESDVSDCQHRSDGALSFI